MKKFASIVAVAAAGLLTVAVSAEEHKMNDLEIAHTAYTAGQLDIMYAEQALRKSHTPAVRKFAEVMLRDHAAVNVAAGNLLKELNVAPQDNDLSKTLVAGAEANRAKFAALSGHDYDCAYAQNELGYHQVVNKTVAEVFIPATTVAPLTALLQDALATFKEHEKHAEMMVADLKCS